MAALYAVWYNWVRINFGGKDGPAMAASVSTRLWEMDDLVKHDWGYEVLDDPPIST